jgi:PTS system cellobiose-specific IIC component
MQKFLNDKLMPALYKFAQYKVLIGIRDGLTIIIPFTIIGSIFLILGNFPVQAWLDFVAPYSRFFDSVANVTFNSLGLIAAIGIGYNMAIQYHVEPISNTALTVISFLLAGELEDGTINIDNFSAAGMFTAILMAIFVTFTFKFFIDKKIVIKLPDGVPPAVANSFVSLIPGAAIIGTVWLIRIVFNVDINNCISLLFSPLVTGYASLPGFIIFIIVYSLLWMVGIHGDLMLEGICTPISLALFAENAAALSAGQPIPNVMSDPLVPIFVNIGGTGGTLALAFMMMRSKSKRYKELGKLSILPGLFNINEPVIFGFPIVMNPVMAIPFLLNGLVLGVGTYLLMQFNIIGRACIEVPWTTPSVLGAFLCTNANIPATVWAICELVISYFIYLPFFKQQEKVELESERNGAEAVSEN